MNKLRLLATLGLFWASSFAYSQYLQSAQVIEQYSRWQVDSFMTANGIPAAVVEIRNPVKAYKITYNTISWDSSATFATGVLFIPDSNVSCKRPILNYNHGTTLKKTDAPSYKVGEYKVGIPFSAAGYIVAMPDYLGLGDGPGFHPYQHAHSEATSIVDLLRASKELMDSLNYPYSDQLFITGYSQGGHAALAAHRLIQQDLPGEFTVTASGPLSGAYDESGVQAEVIVRDSIYDAPGYLPFILFSYNMVYNLYSNWDAVLTPPYNTIIPPLMDGNYSTGYIEMFLPDTPNLIMIPELLDTFANDLNHPFRLALKDNDLYDWVPQCPTRFGYCDADKHVSFLNAIVAQDSMIAHGALDVQAVQVNPSLNHQDCALFALLGINIFFENYREDLLNLDLVVTDNTSGGSNDGMITTSLTGGVPGFAYSWSNSATTPNVNGLSPGSYTVTVTDINGCSTSATANIGTIGLEDENNPMSLQVYPNPSTGYFNVSIDNLKQAAPLKIYNVLGEVVLSKIVPQGASQITIDAYTWPKGMYELVLEYGAEKRFYKIAIQ